MPASRKSTPPAARPPASDVPLFDWLKERGAGVLLHPTALPGGQGCGVLDQHAVRFLDFLQAAGCKYWQVCPLGPTGFGDSPYQCYSAFAGNPTLVDLAVLVRFGLLPASELTPFAALAADTVDFEAIAHLKPRRLQVAHSLFLQKKPALPYGDYAAFCQRETAWLDDYAYFRALKDHFGGQPWWEWPAERDYGRALKSPLRAKLAPETDAYRFGQYLFFGQWAEMRAAAKARGVKIIGDLPIFVAGDSADAWAAPHLFELDAKTLQPVAVAGVPPDYFSADGQMWGNPLYAWKAHAADGYAWWCARLRASLELCDVVRIDHFRGFDAYWRIPLPAENARNGAWVPGPGLDLFRAFRRILPDAQIIAEDLGVLTDSVNRLRADTGLPGMLVLQFAWGGDAKNTYLPHNAPRNAVIYPGTHDNDTTAGWYRHAGEHERDHARRYLRVSGEDIAWDFIRASYASPARLAVMPLQDLFSLGSEARFNTPGVASGNWRWRVRAEALEKLFGGTAGYLRELATLTGR
ncbi:MAG TPA: 4-alpha-glucanotransferase [Lacunisphaera sp.]|nr:4-alpha-glucanotransferase [Lacunisphaera sp.]